MKREGRENERRARIPREKGFLSLFPEPPGRDKYSNEPSMTPYKIREELAR